MGGVVWSEGAVAGDGALETGAEVEAEAAWPSPAGLVCSITLCRSHRTWDRPGPQLHTVSLVSMYQRSVRHDLEL